MWCASRSAVGTLSSVVLVLLLTLPAATAQEAGGPPNLDITVVPVGTPIVPHSGPVDIPLTVTLDCHPPEAAPVVLPLTLTLEVVLEREWADAVLRPANHTFEECPPVGTATMEVTLELTLNASAPATSRLPLKVIAAAGGASADVEWSETVGLTMEVTFAFAETEWKSGPNSRISIPLIVVNRGNDPVGVDFTVAENSSKHLLVAPPGLLIVKAGEKNTVAIDLQTPFENGFIEQRDMLYLDVTARSTNIPEVETHEVLSAEIETVGTYVPGPSAALLLLLLVLMVRTRKRGG